MEQIRRLFLFLFRNLGILRRNKTIHQLVCFGENSLLGERCKFFGKAGETNLEIDMGPFFGPKFLESFEGNLDSREHVVKLIV